VKPGDAQRSITYAAMVESMDAAVGRLLDALIKKFLTDTKAVLPKRNPAYRPGALPPAAKPPGANRPRAKRPNAKRPGGNARWHKQTAPEFRGPAHTSPSLRACFQ
jgi:hypothetical protein